MDAQSCSIVEPNHRSSVGLADDFLPEDLDDGFPADLAPLTECHLINLCDALFVELDSEMPDLRALERYQTICDELALRQIRSGAA